MNISNAFLGAVGNLNYTGVYTPYDSTYRLGGGGGVLNYGSIVADPFQCFGMKTLHIPGQPVDEAKFAKISEGC